MKTTKIKKHIVTDNNGNILLVIIAKANIYDTKICYKLINIVIKNILNRITLIGNEVKKCCICVIEKTFTWLNGYRRSAKDFEYSILIEGF